MAHRPADQETLYQEALWVPWYWWLLGAGFALSLALASAKYFGWGFGLPAGVITMALLGLLFVGYGARRVRVDRDGIWVGRGVLEWEWVGETTVRDRDSTQRRLGPEADARGWLCVRPYLSEAVEVEVRDGADTHPYWLIATRRPAAFAKAIRRGLAQAAPSRSRG